MKHLFLCLVVCICARPVSAGGLDCAQVPANAAWVIHVDLEAARKSRLGRALHAHLLQRANAQSAIESLAREFGFDPTTDVHSATFFDHRFTAHQGAAIVEIEHLDHERLVEYLTTAKPEHTKISRGNHTIYTWKESKQGRPERDVCGAFYGNRHLVFSGDADRLAAVLSVLDGESAALAKDSPLAADVAPGAIFIARAVGMAGQETPFRSRVMQEAQRLSLSMGEEGDDAFVQGMLQTGSGRNAEQLRLIIEGFVSLARAKASGDPLLEKLIERLQIAVADANIAVEWRAKADDVRLMAESMHQDNRD